jgi:hypothetical protein
VEADAIAHCTAETAEVFKRLLSCDGVRSAMPAAVSPASDGPVLPMHFQKDRAKLQLFTTIGTLGTPQDITLQEPRIDSFFSMNGETREVFHEWARPPMGK